MNTVEYDATTFVNGSAPYINAAWLNKLGLTVESLCALGDELVKACENLDASEGSTVTSATSTNYNVTLDGYSEAPAASAYPFSILLVPTVTNAAGLSITLSWGTTKYPVYDISTGAAVDAGMVVANVPIVLVFDGSKFWCDAGGKFLKYGTTGGTWNHETTTPSASTRINYNGYLWTTRSYCAVYNDYAEFRTSLVAVQEGRCVVETGDDSVELSTGRMQGGAMIVSDTYGHAIGDSSGHNVPIAIAGRVLAYPYEDRDEFKPGMPVCSAPNGTVSLMTREEVVEYPERMVGTVSSVPTYETWGTDKVSVNGRVWIKVR